MFLHLIICAHFSREILLQLAFQQVINRLFKFRKSAEESDGVFVGLRSGRGRGFRSSGQLRVSEERSKGQRTELEPCVLALVGVPLIALKIPRESERVFLLPSSVGFI